MTARRSRRTSAPTRNSRRRQSADRQRQRLIDACISALHVYGPSRTTVGKVVAIARLSPGIVRFYFRSKGAMLVASLRFLATEFADYMLEPVGRLSATPVQALQQLVERYLDPAISSPRKVSVWYAFWGEATARQEYLEICGQKDQRFAELVHELIRRMIEHSGLRHLDADAIALGLIGVLEMLWQGFAFQTEEQIDRAGARRRCMAYLASVFPGYFPDQSLPADASRLAPDARFELERVRCFGPCWQLVGHVRELAASGDYLSLELATVRALIVHDGFELRAFRNDCPHQPHALALARRGRLPGRIDCPLHRLSFSLRGQAIGAGEQPGLSPLRIAIAGGFIFVSVASAAAAAPAPDAGGASPLQRAVSAEARLAQLDVAADWKTAVEQLLLHRLPDHEAIGGTLRFTPPLLAIDAEGRGLSWRATPVAAENWSARRLGAVTGAAGAVGWQRWFRWPNLLIEARPDGVSFIQVMPLAPRLSRWQCFDYCYSEANRTELALRFLAGRLARRALRLDCDLAASTEGGLSAPGYAVEIAAQPVSRPVAAFRTMLAETLGGEPPRAGALA